MAERKREIQVKFWVTPEEKKIAYMLYGKNYTLSVCNFKTKDCGYINENSKG